MTRAIERNRAVAVASAQARNVFRRLVIGNRHGRDAHVVGALRGSESEYCVPSEYESGVSVARRFRVAVLLSESIEVTLYFHSAYSSARVRPSPS